MCSRFNLLIIHSDHIFLTKPETHHTTVYFCIYSKCKRQSGKESRYARWLNLLSYFDDFWGNKIRQSTWNYNPPKKKFFWTRWLSSVIYAKCHKGQLHCVSLLCSLKCDNPHVRIQQQKCLNRLMLFFQGVKAIHRDNECWVNPQPSCQQLEGKCSTDLSN